MSITTLTHQPTEANRFDTGLSVQLGHSQTATVEPFEDGVALMLGEDGERCLTPSEACALAAALQAAAVYVMESQPREFHRATEPGTPDLDGIGGGL